MPWFYGSIQRDRETRSIRTYSLGGLYRYSLSKWQVDCGQIPSSFLNEVIWGRVWYHTCLSSSGFSTDNNALVFLVGVHGVVGAFCNSKDMRRNLGQVQKKRRQTRYFLVTQEQTHEQRHFSTPLSGTTLPRPGKANRQSEQVIVIVILTSRRFFPWYDFKTSSV